MNTKKVAALAVVLPLAFGAFAATASAGERDRGHRGGNSTSITNQNTAVVVNGVHSSANTGMNTTDGGDGGNGRNGGDGGRGGAIYTGNILSTTVVDTTANSNLNRVTGDSDRTRILNQNRAMVMNFVGSDANTGLNSSEGGNGGDTCGCEDDRKPKKRHHKKHNRGGDAGDGGRGGLIVTGAIDTATGVSVVANSNVNRVKGSERGPRGGGQR